MDKKPSYYEFFGLENFEPDPVKIKRAYRSMALKHHPDRNKDKDASEHIMKQINEVYKVLSQHKDQYDRHLKVKLGLVVPVEDGIIISFAYQTYGPSSSTTTGHGLFS